MNIQAQQILETLKSRWDSIPWEYMIFLSLTGTVFALLNCFMGYRLRKVWGCILGILAGAGAGAAGTYLYTHDQLLAIAGGAAGALILGIMAWFFYKFGVFVMCTGLVYGMILSLFQDASMVMHIVSLIVGVFAGTLALGYERPLVIGITSLCGGIGGMHLLLSMTKVGAGMGELLLGLILAAFGAIVQTAPFLKERGRKKSGKGLMSIGGLPGFPGRRRKKSVKKVQVEKRKEYTENPGGKSSRPKDYDPEDYDEEMEEWTEPEPSVSEAREDLEKTQVYQIGQGQYPGGKKEGPTPYLGQGIGIDLDDLNRELSKEIKKIYEEEE